MKIPIRKFDLKRHGLRMALGVLATIAMLMHVMAVFPVPFLDQLEALAYDARVRLTSPNTIDSRIVIVDIDEKSLEAEGRWPWGRDKVAQLLDNLFEKQKVAIVGFDVVFAEPDNSSGLPVLREIGRGPLKHDMAFQAVLQKIAPRLDRDQKLANALSHRPTILGYYFTNKKRGGKAHIAGALPEPTFNFIEFVDRNIPFLSADGYGGNLKPLQQAAMDGGHFNPLYDVDGVSRRVPMLMEFDGDYYQSLALAMTRAYLGGLAVKPGFSAYSGDDYTDMEWLQIGQHRIPIDENIAALVPYRGKQGSFPYVSATDVLRNKLPPGELGGKIILVGTSAPGLMDLRVTPVENAYPGVEIHANLIAGILDDNIKHKPAYVLGYEIVVVLVIGLFLAIMLPSMSPLHATLTTLFLLTATIASNLAAWQFGNLVLPLSNLLQLCLGIYVLDILYGFFVESRAKQRITDLFGQYVPPRVVDALSLNPEIASMEGDSREMTVLFSDIRDFTRMSEGLSAQELSRLMNAYLTRMTEIIQKHNGTVDKYIGDAIMAFWGAPLTDPEHQKNALLAAMEMQESLVGLNAIFGTHGWPTLKIGIGLNSGVMNVGNMGSAFRRAYTVMGDAVNLGSRLESLTKRYGVGILISESTRLANPDMVCRELDRIQVKGKDEPVTIFQPLGPEDALPKGMKERLPKWDELYRQYQAAAWAQAESTLQTLAEMGEYPALISLFQERIEQLRAAGIEPGWNGVFAFDSK